jgi:ABC-type hemin transport system substrate-binding protein
LPARNREGYGPTSDACRPQETAEFLCPRPVSMRIVSLTPSITEALCMLGLESSLVGVTDYCLHPADILASKKRVGGTKAPRIPDIQRLRPDVVIVNTDENRRQTFNGLQSVGLHVLVTQTDSLNQIEATWLQLGKATGTAGLANERRERLRPGAHGRIVEVRRSPSGDTPPDHRRCAEQAVIACRCEIPTGRD